MLAQTSIDTCLRSAETGFSLTSSEYPLFAKSLCQFFVRQSVVWIGEEGEMGQMTLLPWNTPGLYSTQDRSIVLVALSHP